jgi:hypothetical protein
MEKEFKRMQFLAGLVKENIIYEEETNFSDLSNLDDIIKQELEKAEKQQPVDEIVGLSTAALILAIPGMINGFTKIIKAIKSKAPAKFNLNKKDDNKSHLDFIIDFTGKIDSYLDTPFKTVLTPFIRDQIKRDKVANFLKAIVLLIMSSGIDISKSPEIMNIGKELASNVFDFKQLAQEMFTNPNIATLITKAKQIIPKLIS